MDGVERVLLFIPMYNCEKQIPRVIRQVDEAARRYVDEVLVVDNRSSDGSREAAMAAMQGLAGVTCTLVQNDANYGLGGSHKVAFDHAAAHGFDYLIVLHGDDQGSLADILPLLATGDHRKHDCLLGARFMAGAKLENYSLFRTFGNHVFNLFFAAASGKRLHDLGSGLNLYKVSSLRTLDYCKNANDLTFNYYMILRTVARHWDIRFFPITWREADQVSNVKLFRQVRRTLGLLGQFAANRKTFLETDHSERGDAAYPSTVVYNSAV